MYRHKEANAGSKVGTRIQHGTWRCRLFQHMMILKLKDADLDSVNLLDLVT